VVVRFGHRGGEVALPQAPGPWKVVHSSHDLATPTVGSRLAVRPLEAIVLRPDLEGAPADGVDDHVDPPTIHG
jgi:hypothetical protein